MTMSIAHAGRNRGVTSAERQPQAHLGRHHRHPRRRHAGTPSSPTTRASSIAHPDMSLVLRGDRPVVAAAGRVGHGCRKGEAAEPAAAPCRRGSSGSTARTVLSSPCRRAAARLDRLRRAADCGRCWRPSIISLYQTLAAARPRHPARHRRSARCSRARLLVPIRAAAVRRRAARRGRPRPAHPGHVGRRDRHAGAPLQRHGRPHPGGAGNAGGEGRRRAPGELAASLEDLRAAQDRLVQTEKLASLGQLTAGIAHEIKNPLNFVNNFAELSRRTGRRAGGGPRAPAGASTERCAARGRRAHRHAEGQPRQDRAARQARRLHRAATCCCIRARAAASAAQVDLNALVEESAEPRLSRRARREGRASTSRWSATSIPAAGEVDALPAGDHPRAAQPDRQRLLRRAPSGADRRAATGLRADARGRPRGPAANACEIRIRDNGTGIPDDVRGKHLRAVLHHQADRRGHRARPVDLSHDIVVKQHGGTIDVETEPGEFTEFIITLPRGAAADRREARHEPSDPGRRRRARRRGAVPPAVPARPAGRPLRAWSSRRPLRPRSTSSASARDVSIILLLSDINMPGMSGLDLLPQVKAVAPRPAGHHDHRLWRRRDAPAHRAGWRRRRPADQADRLRPSCAARSTRCSALDAPA